MRNLDDLAVRSLLGIWMPVKRGARSLEGSEEGDHSGSGVEKALRSNTIKKEPRRKTLEGLALPPHYQGGKDSGKPSLSRANPPDSPSFTTRIDCGVLVKCNFDYTPMKAAFLTETNFPTHLSKEHSAPLCHPYVRLFMRTQDTRAFLCCRQVHV